MYGAQLFCASQVSLTRPTCELRPSTSAHLLDQDPYADARLSHVGIYSGWLTKVKGDTASIKWLSNTNKRYFTINFESQTFYYSHNVHLPARSPALTFKDIINVEHLEDRVVLPPRKQSNKLSFGFRVNFQHKTMELRTSTALDATLWVNALNAGRDLAERVSASAAATHDVVTAAPEHTNQEPAMSQSASGALSQTGSTTADGSSFDDSGTCSSSTTSADKLEAFGTGLALPLRFSPSPPSTEDPNSPVRREPAAEQEPQDPFAALDALELMAGPAPEAKMPSQTVNRSQMLKEARRLIIEPGSTRAPRSPPPTSADAISLASSQAALQRSPLLCPTAQEQRQEQLERQHAWCASDGVDSTGNSSVTAPVATGTAVGEDSDWDDDARGSPSASVNGNQQHSGSPWHQQQTPLGWGSSDDNGPPTRQAWGASAAPLPQCCSSAPPPPTAVPLASNPQRGPVSAAPPQPASISDACGAPQPPAQTFVAARRKNAGGECELDDLVCDLLDNDSSVIGYGPAPGLHCLGCDSQVVQVENHVWSEDVEYMFLRNNYPTYEKLRKRLVHRGGCRAYCCQCSWRSAEVGADLADVADGLRWRLYRGLCRAL